MLFSQLKPNASTNWLVAAAGLTWSTVGIMMCRQAAGWCGGLVFSTAVLSGGTGIIGAVAASHFVFSAIAIKNIDRLSHFQGKACFFAFQAWKSYVVIAVMVALGVMLRRSQVPREFLAALYMTIGGALVLSSRHYYVRLHQLIFPKKT